MKKLKVAFLSNKLTLRGTEVNIYDLADFNEKILGNESVIITRPYDYVLMHSPRDVSKMAYEKFEKRFKVFYYRYPNWGIPNYSPPEIREIVKNENIDVLFVEKSGNMEDGLVFDYCPTIIHCVFTTMVPHGTVYSSISDSLNKIMGTNYPVIPYMVRVFDTKEDLRVELGIPKEALVFGTMSGTDEFTVEYVREVVETVVNEDREIYFVFLNIDKFGPESKKLIFLPGTADMEYKRKFINTCDGMLYGRSGGETFGLACGEFSISGKPVIGRTGEKGNSHEEILGDAMIKHNNYEECYDIVTNWGKYNKDVSNNGYYKYTPENVMKILEKYLYMSLDRIKRVYFNGFWSGFFENTNAVNSIFFIKLLREVYDCYIEIGDYNNSEILVENTQITETLRDKKNWETTYLFSCESYIRADMDKYDCVLYGKRNYKNVVNVPLYIPYLVSSFDNVNFKCVNSVPESDVLAIISNPGGNVRNQFMERLESEIRVDYGGSYKNNIGGRIIYNYNSKEFLEIVGKYKFIVSMENLEEDTYITEKIMHGLIGGSIPIYWGSKRVSDYINLDRIILKEDLDKSMDLITKMTDEEWLRRVKCNPLTEYGMNYYLNEISRGVRNVINCKNARYNFINDIYCISNIKYEPVRYERVKKLAISIVGEDRVRMIGPTYKNTITDDIYKKYVKEDLVLKVRYIPTKRGELSLTLNWRALFEDIEKRYNGGIFIILESDVEQMKIFDNKEGYGFKECVELLEIKLLNGNRWDVISLGYSTENDLKISYNPYETPYRRVLNTEEILRNSNNDMTVDGDKIIFYRKFHTRCTDSFIFTYEGAMKLLKYMRFNENYGVPFDYYLSNYLENNMDYKFYWTDKSYFNQLSNQGKEASTIQNDIN